MGIVVGIDIGGSTTKIVGIENGNLKTPMLVTATDPVASLFGAFGKFVDYNSMALADIEQVMVTGVGSSFIDRPIYGIKTGKVEEFLANGFGGLHLSKLKKAIIVSMGTGTALVSADEDQIRHIGGTGIGGGTITGLAAKMLNIRDIDLVVKLANSGNLKNIDLMVGDITQDDLPGLPPHTTASNFGKISDVASLGDIALGILNLVFQSIGTTASFAVKNENTNDVVLIGNLTSIPHCLPMFKELADLYKINFIMPEYSEFGTAVGAALSLKNGRFRSL